jgi:hypothetical protein
LFGNFFADSFGHLGQNPRWQTGAGCLVGYYPPPHSGVPLASYFLAPMQLSAYSEYIKKLPFVKMFSDIVSHSTASKILKHMLSLFVTFVVNGKKILFN